MNFFVINYSLIVKLNTYRKLNMLAKVVLEISSSEAVLFGTKCWLLNSFNYLGTGNSIKISITFYQETDIFVHSCYLNWDYNHFD